MSDGRPHSIRRIRADELTPLQLDRIRRDYEGSELTNAIIAQRYGQSPNWVTYLATEHGWPRRPRYWRPGYDANAAPKAPSRPGPKKRSKLNPFSPAALLQEQRKDEERRRVTLYGDLAADVEFLRKCGFAIHKERGGIRFGNALVSADEIRAKAERERRLRLPAPAPIGPTRVRA